jgi:predicted aconitase
MILTPDEQHTLDGHQGSTLQKVMRTLVLYGEALEAERFVDIDWGGHFSIPFALPGVGPRLEMLDELAHAGLKTKHPFTLDPRAPTDYETLGVTPKQKELFQDMLRDQPAYDERMLQLGLRDKDAYTCTPYFPEVGNTPPRAAVLAWSESSCVVYANSVLGARTNRNSSIVDILSNIIGKTPLTGFLTDRGRRAKWLVEVKTNNRPNPQLLGAAIGMKVLEDVPFITGLDRFLTPRLEPATIDFLKEMGAACAAIGAVGLYHVENVTPEAIDHGNKLLRADYRTYTIDDQALEALFSSYPVMWQDRRAAPRKCIIGCPHLSLKELYGWTENICDALEAAGREQVAVETLMCAAPQIIQKFQADEKVYDRLKRTGVKLTDTCPEAYMNNRLCAREAVVTNSNKFRAFTTARMYLDQDLIQVIVGVKA